MQLCSLLVFAFADDSARLTGDALKLEPNKEHNVCIYN